MSKVICGFRLEFREVEAPSVNKLYAAGPHGRRILSREGRIFKSALTEAVLATTQHLPWHRAVDAVYQEQAWTRLEVVIHAPIYNGSWKAGGRTEKSNLQSPYKKMDGSNLMKAIEDAVSDGTGIDDSANLAATVRKVHDPMKYIEITYEVLAKE